MGGGDEAESERLVAGDRAVLAGLELGGRHAHVGVGDLGGLAVGVSGVERASVGLGEIGGAPEALLDPVEGGL